MGKFLNRKTMTVVLVLVAVWLGRDAWNVHLQKAAISSQLSDLQVKVSHVQEENQFLASSSAYFKSDEYLEKQARLKLNYKLPDENVAFIYPDKSVKTASASAPAATSWLDWLKHLFNK